MRKPELIHGLPFADYLEIPALSQSTLKRIERSPGHLQHYLAHGMDRTPWLDFGAAADCLRFEGRAAFESQYVARPPGLDLRTKDGRAWKAKHGHKTLVPPAVETCLAAVEAHPVASELLSGGEAQLSVVWRDPDTGEWLRGRPDYYIPDDNMAPQRHPTVVDLKTTDDASPEAFGRKAYGLRYHWQAAMYLDGLEAVTGRPHEDFVLVVAERDPPHRVEVYRVPEEIILQGRLEYYAALELYAKCRRDNSWPTSSGQLQTLEFPGWARR
jgi:exodeoxyribonuclease VIII